MKIAIFGNPPVTPEALVEVRKQVALICIEKGITGSLVVGWHVTPLWAKCAFVFYHGDTLCVVQAPLAEAVEALQAVAT